MGVGVGVVLLPLTRDPPIQDTLWLCGRGRDPRSSTGRNDGRGLCMSERLTVSVYVCMGEMCCERGTRRPPELIVAAVESGSLGWI